MVLKYNYLVSFDDTAVGNVATTSYCIQNESNHTNFIIAQHPKFECILNPFTVKKKSGGKRRNYEIIITYSPTVALEKNVNYFVLKNDEKSIVLCVRGQCKELTVTPSVSELIFYRLCDEQKTKATFTLTNTSEQSVQFQFDIDNKQNLFHIDPIFGEIVAGKHIYIHVTFISENSGTFYLPLPCLILYNEPIIIGLMAINASAECKKILSVFQRRSSCLKFETCFAKYCNLNTPTTSAAACSLSNKYFDFTMKNPQNLNTKLLEIKNNSNKCIKIQFDTDNEKIFALDFPKICLDPDASGYLECRFTPAVQDKLYGSILYGRAINVDDNDAKTIPVPLILRTTGSSFTANNTWYPRLQIHPDIIRMPVVVPKEKVYTTFQLKNLGQYPIVFKVLAPRKTHFSILPLNGIIEEGYQIFVVEFYTNFLENQSYQESWHIELNYQPDSHRELLLRALVENPQVRVGSNNTVRFGNIFPGCEQHLLVPVVNLTQLSLRYTFYNNQWINIENNIGEIHNHETVHLKWTYTADLQVPAQFELKYELSLLQNGDLQVGPSLEFSVCVFAECSYTKLCAMPNYSSLTDLVCYEQIAFSFHLFNFGNCEVNFKLKLKQNYDIPGFGNITIAPTKGTVTSRQGALIEGTLVPSRIGPGTFCVKYYVTRSPTCDHMIATDDTVWPSTGILYKMDYCSAYPILKIVDIGRNKAGPLFGKLNIWEFFQIERLNSILKNIKANQSVNFDVNIPEAQADIDITKIFTFVIKNTSNINTTCKIVRKKNCNCKLREIYTSTSIRKYSYGDCPHRDILDIAISDENIRAQDIQYIFIQVFYNLFGSHTTLHTMQLSHNRTINLYLHIKGLEPSNLSIFTQNLTFSLYNVFIGELDADLQIFWFYNNTRKSASYSLDTDVLDDLNIQYHTNVITCLNPRDKVAGKTVHALIFKYSPIDTEYLEVKLPLFLSGIKHYFTIHGRGTLHYRSPIHQIAGHGPSKQIYYHPDLVMQISTEHIIVPAIATYSSVTRIFCLKNISTENHVAFCFESYYRKNVIYATVEPAKGILKPRECIWLKVRLDTYGQACTIRITCCCHLLDKTALFKHIQSCTDYHQEATILHDQFEITAKGITYPKSTITLEPQPTIFHRILAISCHIVGTPDLDFKMSLHQQLKQLPVPHISLYTSDVLENMFAVGKLVTDNVEQPINTLYAKKIMRKLDANPKNPQTESQREKSTCCTDKKCPKYDNRMYALIRTVLECLMHDVVFSKKFRYIIESMQNLPNKYYAEFSNDNFDLTEKKLMTKSILNHAPNNVVSGVLQHLLYDCVRQHFKLCSQPVFSQTDDALTKMRCRNTKTKSVYIEKFSFLFDDV